VRRDPVDGDLEEVVARLGDVGAAGEDGVAVAAAEQEVVGDDPHGVGGTQHRERACDTLWCLPDRVDDRRRPVAVELHLEAGDLREPAGPAGEARIAERVKPFRNAVSSWAPVSVRITDRLPNGSTANISPQVISPGCSPALGGAKTRFARRPPELV